MKNGLFLAAAILAAFVSCKGEDPVEPTPTPTPTPTPVTPVKTIDYYKFVGSSANMMKYSYNSSTGVSTIVTQGVDPYIRLEAFKKDLPADSCVLTFKYKAEVAMLDNIQLFFGPAESEARSARAPSLKASGNDWNTYTFDLSQYRKDFSWGSSGDLLRMDFGSTAGLTFYIKELYIRSLTAEEKKAKEEYADEVKRREAKEARLKEYLDKDYASKVTEVEVTKKSVIVKGTCSGNGTFALSEIMPWMDVTELEEHPYKTSIEGSTFSVELDRKVKVEGYEYDRLLSKWAIVETGSGKDVLSSHARYADKVEPVYTPEPIRLKTKKGVAGVGMIGAQNDIKDLGVGSTTMNVSINEALSLSPSYETMEFLYAGKTFYVNSSFVNDKDGILAYQYAPQGLVTMGIVLINADGYSEEVDEMLKHPDNSGGYFAMPDMTTVDGVMHYAAIMDFLTERYSGKTEARFSHWIMHNEIDAARTWTNMGEDQPELCFMDTYVKSMRLVYNLLRQYDQNANVLASFTHNWTAKGEDYYVVNLLDDLQKYSATEGDFLWGLAMHPYPKNLTAPSFWNDDADLTSSMDAPYVTFYNLEVYDKWAKDPAHFYMGKQKRFLTLSENGTNTADYSDESQNLQAAGACWTWKKVKALDGIDAIQWHAWVDHEAEFGLRLGIRKFGSDENDPYGKKKSWYVFQAADTDKEDEVFAPYLGIIGKKDWNEIMLK